MVSFANGLRMSLRVARRLERDGIRARVVDLRWLAPLPVDDILAAARATGRVLVVDETRASGGVSEGVVTALVDAGYAGRIRRVTSKDSFVPLGPAAAHVLLGEDGDRGRRRASWPAPEPPTPPSLHAAAEQPRGRAQGHDRDDQQRHRVAQHLAGRQPLEEHARAR